MEDNLKKPLVSSVVESLKQEDPIFGKLMDAWHLGQMQKDPSCPSSLLDALSNWLDKGTC